MRNGVTVNGLPRSFTSHTCRRSSNRLFCPRPSSAEDKKTGGGQWSICEKKTRLSSRDGSRTDANCFSRSFFLSTIFDRITERSTKKIRLTSIKRNRADVRKKIIAPIIILRRPPKSLLQYDSLFVISIETRLSFYTSIHTIDIESVNNLQVRRSCE